MYLDFFKFREEPFNNTPDPKFFFFSRQHEEALESLLYGINNRKGFMALIGDIGTGKTTLCRALVKRLENNVDTSVIFNPMLSVIELLKSINEDFGNPHSFEDTAKEQIDALNSFLLRRLRWNKNACVIIDEAQLLSVEALEMLRLLSNLETDNKKLVQFVFLGQKELETKLHAGELRQLNQRIAIRYLLSSLNYDEMVRYITHRITVSGGVGMVQFQEDAARAIYDHSGGVPRVINCVCDRALLQAFAEKTNLITKRIVKKSIEDIEGTGNDVSAIKKLNFFKGIFKCQ